MKNNQNKSKNTSKHNKNTANQGDFTKQANIHDALFLLNNYLTKGSPQLEQVSFSLELVQPHFGHLTTELL